MFIRALMDLNMKPGDLVRTKKMGGSYTRVIAIFSAWQPYMGEEHELCDMFEGDIGLVIGTGSYVAHHFGAIEQHGCKVLLPNGTVGWCITKVLEVVK